MKVHYELTSSQTRVSRHLNNHYRHLVRRLFSKDVSFTHDRLFRLEVDKYHQLVSEFDGDRCRTLIESCKNVEQAVDRWKRRVEAKQNYELKYVGEQRKRNEKD